METNNEGHAQTKFVATETPRGQNEGWQMNDATKWGSRAWYEWWTIKGTKGQEEQNERLGVEHYGYWSYYSLT